MMLRFTLVTLSLLAGCDQQPAPIPSSNTLTAPEMRFECARSGHVVLLYTTSQGNALDPIPTGEMCDYSTSNPKLDRQGIQ